MEQSQIVKQTLQAVTAVAVLTISTGVNADDQFGLHDDASALEIIEVKGQRNKANSEMSYDTENLLKVAGLANDPLAAVYTLPGVVYAGGDDGGTPAIRGSSPGDNAFYIDNVQSGYIFHLFGDSIFNENVVQDFALHPAAFGSQYGNATGGVFDVKLRDPRNQDITTTLDISMIRAGAMVEGAVNENQAFYFSYRHSLIQLFIPTDEELEDEPGITVYKAPVSDDYQGKYQWLIGDQHKLTFNINGASDTVGANIAEKSEIGMTDPDIIGDLEITTRFDNQSISWEYFGEENKLMHFIFGHTSTNEKESLGSGQFVNVDSEKFTARFAYQIDWIEDHKLVTGIDLDQEETKYSFDTIVYYCTDSDADCESKKGDRIQDQDTLNNVNVAGYVNDIWNINQNWQLETGLRAEYNDYVDESFVHPRVSLSWYATDDLIFTTKAGTYSQFPEISTVLEKIGNPDLKSPTAKHYSLLTNYKLSSLWETSIDVYYKDLGELARSINEGEPNAELHYSNDVSGTAKGVEWLIKRDNDNGWFGWASVSWSQTQRTDEFTQQTSDYYLDTPIVGNLVTNYELNENWDFGLKYTIRSGAKYTPIIGLRVNPDYPDHYQAEYGELNSKTLPVYQRLDLEANYHTTLWSNPARWTFAILNATASENVSGYYFAPDGNETLTDYKVESEEGMTTFLSIGLKMSF